MYQPLQIGITGGIGSGKSIVCKIFNILGIPSYDSDSRAKWLSNHDLEVITKIKNEFGDNFYVNGVLDSKKLAKEVFDNKQKLEKLNEIVHPAVAIDYKNWVSLHQTSSFLLKEAALIFETGINNKMDAVITVYSPLELRIKRVLSRDPFRSKEAILAIINKQMNDEEKVKLANFVVYNNDNTLLMPQILKIHQQLSDIGNSRLTTK